MRAFVALPEASALAAANKRISNILKKIGGNIDASYDDGKLREPSEIALSQALYAVNPKALLEYQTARFSESLQTLSVLKLPVDDFFNKVMVNSEDPAVRANRLGLLKTLYDAMNRVADLSKLAS